MSDNKRTLTINPALFRINGKEKKKNKSLKQKPIVDEENSKNANKVKQAMLKRVQNYQKNKEQEKIREERNEEKEKGKYVGNLFEKNDFENSDFEREFDKSLNFLQDLAKKNKEKKRKKNATMKAMPNIEINMDLPNELQRNKVDNSSEPQYGCLKQGSKPTFRQLNKTQKNHGTVGNQRIKIVLENNAYDDDPNAKFVKPKPITNNAEKTEFNEIIDKKIEAIENLDTILKEEKTQNLNMDTDKDKNTSVKIDTDDSSWDSQPMKDLKKALDSSEENAIISSVEPVPINVTKTDPELELENSMKKLPKINRITRTKKYKLGKKKGANHVGILIKNRETQKNIKHEVGLLKTKSIQEIKDFLRQKNLIKVGSQAPNDVLRKLYENAMLSGDVENNNNNNLLFNYLNEQN